MSLHSQPIPPVPTQTARIAHAAFPHGNRTIHLRDELGSIFADEDFATLFPQRGQPAQTPWRLALVTLMQYLEDLSDRQAADAVRGRLDWKYALSPDLDDPGFDSSVLCEFRSRLVVGQAEGLLLEKLLTLCQERKWLRPGGKQRTDSTHVVAAVTALNRLQCAMETLRHALNVLALVAPDWLQEHTLPEWVERYAPRALDHPTPTGSQERKSYAQTIGVDGFLLLNALHDPEAPAWLPQVSALEVLRQVWVQQFYWCQGQIHWRTEKEGIPPSRLFLSSPYDLQARLGKKRTTQWVGYKVHLTETCDQELPHLITHVETTAAPIADGTVTPIIHRDLHNKRLLPKVHLVDTGYLDAALLATTQDDYQVNLLGPTRPNYKWQARAATGFETDQFTLDWQRQLALCPAGRQSISWTPAVDDKSQEVIKIKFSQKDCLSCVDRAQCTWPKRRTITVRHQRAHQALEQARQREKTPEFKAEYRQRAGIEGTISQGVRAFGLRRSRYKGLGKTKLQHIVTAAAINLARLDDWLSGKPLASTRQSAFVHLLALGS